MNKDISKTKFFITGGGTGGHIYPAVSVINELFKAGVSRENLFYIGNKKNLEYKIALDNGYNFLSTPVFGMPRKFSLKFLKWAVFLLIAVMKSVFYFLKYKPDAVFATGGYICAPVLFAGRLFKVPYVLHDSDCFPGVVTRSFAKGAKAVNLAFEEAEKYIKSSKIYHFNNPVRNSFFENTKETSRAKLGIKNEFLILVTGGSQGAKSLNNAAIELIKHFALRKDLKIILQTGKKNYEETMKALEIPSNARIEPYFDDMSIPVLAADLVISRAGSISISEILSAKTPAILVPYPYAAADHQRFNARAIEAKGAAVYLEDANLDKLAGVVEEILADSNALKESAARAGENFKGSTEKITELVLNAAKAGL